MLACLVACLLAYLVANLIGIAPARLRSRIKHCIGYETIHVCAFGSQIAVLSVSVFLQHAWGTFPGTALVASLSIFCSERLHRKNQRRQHF